MRRVGITIVVVALSVAGVATAARATETFGLRTPVAATPAHGTPTTTFTIRFRTPFTTGSLQGLRSWEIASVAERGQSGPSCTSSAAKQLPSAIADHRVSVMFPAAAKGWCAGTFTGTITLYRSIICNFGPPSPRNACPQIAFAPETIGHFRVTVASAT